MSYKESFLIPKSAFLTVTKQQERKKINDDDRKKRSTKKKQEAHFPNKRKRGRKQLTSDTSAHKLKPDHQRKGAFSTLKKRSRLNRLSKARNERLFRKAMIDNSPSVSAGTTNPTDERKSFFHFFPREDHHIIHRVLDILSKYSDKISWDAKSYEVTFSGKFYPETSLIDMLNFLLDNGVSFRSEEENSRIPKHIEKLLDIFKDYFNIRDINLLPNYIAFDAVRVNRVYKFRMGKNARMFERTMPKTDKKRKYKRRSFGASPDFVRTILTEDDPEYEEEEEILFQPAKRQKRPTLTQSAPSKLIKPPASPPKYQSTPHPVAALGKLYFSDDEDDDGDETVIDQMEKFSPIVKRLRDRGNIKTPVRYKQT